MGHDVHAMHCIALKKLQNTANKIFRVLLISIFPSKHGFHASPNRARTSIVCLGIRGKMRCSSGSRRPRERLTRRYVPRKLPAPHWSDSPRIVSLELLLGFMNFSSIHFLNNHHLLAKYPQPLPCASRVFRRRSWPSTAIAYEKAVKSPR